MNNLWIWKIWWMAQKLSTVYSSLNSLIDPEAVSKDGLFTFFKKHVFFNDWVSGRFWYTYVLCVPYVLIYNCSSTEPWKSAFPSIQHSLIDLLWLGSMLLIIWLPEQHATAPKWDWSRGGGSSRWYPYSSSHDLIVFSHWFGKGEKKKKNTCQWLQFEDFLLSKRVLTQDQKSLWQRVDSAK